MSNAFDSVIGYEKIKRDLLRVVDMIKNPTVYEKISAQLPHGILLEGAVGIGKSLMSNCFIVESGLPCFPIKREGSDDDFLDHIIEIYGKAKEHAPSIVYIDDMDKLTSSDNNRRNEPEFCCIQSSINDVKDSKVITLATINDADILPESLLRVGRFDMFIRVPRPSKEDVRKIMKHYLEGKNLDPNIDINDLCNMLEGDSVAMLETCINEASIMAAFERCDCIKREHLIRAVLSLRYNCDTDDDSQNAKERESTVVHESGHLVVSELLLKGSVGIASVLGDRAFVRRCESFDDSLDNVRVSLGGMVASELLLPRVVSGCCSDNEKALRKLNVEIENEGRFGLINLEPPYGSSDYHNRDLEIVSASELCRLKDDVRIMLLNNIEFLKKTIEALDKNEVLLTSDISKIRDACSLTV